MGLRKVSCHDLLSPACITFNCILYVIDMAEPLSLFRWTVPLGGVRLVTDAEGTDLTSEEWHSLGEALVPQGEGRRETDPLVATPLLFEVLATAPLEGEALAALAGRVGLLGLEPPLVTSPSGRRETGKRVLDRPVESVAQWRTELLRLRDAFELWGAVSALAEARKEPHRARTEAARLALGERVQLRDGFTQLTDPHHSQVTRIGKPGDEIERLLRAYPTDLLLAGRLALRQVLDRQLKRHTRLRMVYDEGLRALRLRAGPKSLLGAAWLQLAESAAGGRKPRRCFHCSQWFVVKSGRRGHDRYCKAACRQAHQRVRSRAYELADGGRSVRSIAKKVGVPLWLVQEWLEKRKARR